MPWDRAKYPANWRAVVARVRERSGDRCECRGECASAHCRARGGERCPAVHGEPHPETGSRVVLTTAHLDHDPSHGDLARLRHLCQRCHLAYDARLHVTHARQTRVRRREEGGQCRLALASGGRDESRALVARARELEEAAHAEPQAAQPVRRRGVKTAVP